MQIEDKFTRGKEGKYACVSLKRTHQIRIFLIDSYKQIEMKKYSQKDILLLKNMSLCDT